MNITMLGEARFSSPLPHHVSDKARVLYNVFADPDVLPKAGILLEVAGPRERLFFDPKETRAGIVTCGGQSPRLNNLIRSLVFQLHHSHGVREIIDFVDGYKGPDPWHRSDPVALIQAFSLRVK